MLNPYSEVRRANTNRISLSFRVEDSPQLAAGSFNADGGAVVELHDEAGKSRARLALAKDGRPTLSLVGDPAVMLLDNEEKFLWKAP